MRPRPPHDLARRRNVRGVGGVDRVSHEGVDRFGAGQ